jgi:hypothetical protein
LIIASRTLPPMYPVAPVLWCALARSTGNVHMSLSNVLVTHMNSFFVTISADLSLNFGL